MAVVVGSQTESGRFVTVVVSALKPRLKLPIYYVTCNEAGQNKVRWRNNERGAPNTIIIHITH